MVAQQEPALTLMMKGKRSKRPRTVSPVSMVVDEGETSSIESARLGSGNITEEEDMAHCLILLAQGLKPKRRNNEDNKWVGLPYECKTCNKSFPSFQALGGHRASHKKPKLETVDPVMAGFKPGHPEKKSSDFFSVLDNGGDFYDHDRNNSSFNERLSLSLQIVNGTTYNTNNSSNNNNNKSTKVHECGICGAEFSSGQALGGHMRRHRPIGGSLKSVTSSSTINVLNVNYNNSNSCDKDEEKIKTRNFSLDLNLPAPEDEHQHQHQHQQGGSNFVFTSKEKTLVFTSPSLVNCHY